MERIAKIAILTLLSLLIMVPSAFAAILDTDQRALLNMINNQRQEKGLKALKWGFRIERTAERHSEDMATKAYMAHRSPEGSTLTKRLKHSGISTWTKAAENITTAGTEKAVYNKWLGSKGDRAKMLDSSYTHVGIGITEGGEKGNVYTLVMVKNPRLKKSMPAAAKTIMTLVNAERAKAGVAPLTWGHKLAKAGRLHSADMIQNSYFSHTSKDGRGVTDRLSENGINGWWSAGENIAGTTTGDRAFKQWMESDGHRRNMLSDKYTHAGVGIASNGGFSIYTMDLVGYAGR